MPQVFTKGVATYISNALFYIILNRDMNDYIKSFNGLIKGCHLSPISFTIITNVLLYLLDKELIDGKFHHKNKTKPPLLNFSL